MIDINNKKFNFYDPVTIVDNDKEDLIFSETLYILSEKYIPSRENKMIMNQFENLVINHNNTEEKQKTSEKIYTGFEYLISTDLVTKLEENQNELSLLSSNFILLDINHNNNYLNSHSTIISVKQASRSYHLKYSSKVFFSST